MFVKTPHFQLGMLQISVFFKCLGVILAQNYCGICADHSMCKLPSIGPECEPLLSSGVTLEQEKEIVEAHNDLRRRVAKGEETWGIAGGQPQASNMMKMKWDNELAAIAQRWADQCTFGHDECRNVERFSVGQNVRMTSTSDDDSEAHWLETVDSWYDEVEIFDEATIDPFEFNSETGHYSQVVWADTRLVGCGVSSYKSKQMGPWFNKLYVCNYGGAGNSVGGAMYEKGDPCDKCPEGTTCEDGLCAW